MKAACFSEFGPASDVTSCGDVPAPGAASGDRVTVEMLAMPINPADILMIEGDYGHRPKLPCVPGAEGVGRVIEVGEDVRRITLGDLVIPIGGNNWQERVQCPERLLIPVPGDLDIEQASMIKANPATAEAMLAMVDLEPGDWVIQNAANSAVGRLVISAARRRGVRVVALVRRAEVVSQLQDDGAEIVLVADETTPSDDLIARLAEVAGAARPRLALDAIGGPATNQLAACLGKGGLVVNYGLLSGKPCQIDADHLVFRRVTLTGFWLADWFTDTAPARIAQVYADLARDVRDGRIATRVAARYPLSEIKAALTHAAQPGRDGKILLVPGMSSTAKETR